MLSIIDSGGIPMIGGVDALVVAVAALDHSQAYWAAACATLGSVIGSGVLFFLARKGGEAYLERHAVSGRGAKFRTWFQEFGMLTIFIPAFVPVIPMPMKIFILSAGAMGVSPWTFVLVLSGARIPRYVFLAWLGTKLGKDTLPYLGHHLWQFAALAGGLFIVLYFVVRFVHDRRMAERQSY